MEETSTTFPAAHWKMFEGIKLRPFERKPCGKLLRDPDDKTSDAGKVVIRTRAETQAEVAALSWWIIITWPTGPRPSLTYWNPTFRSTSSSGVVITQCSKQLGPSGSVLYCKTDTEPLLGGQHSGSHHNWKTVVGRSSFRMASVHVLGILAPSDVGCRIGRFRRRVRCMASCGSLSLLNHWIIQLSYVLLQDTVFLMKQVQQSECWESCGVHYFEEMVISCMIEETT